MPFVRKVEQLVERVAAERQGFRRSLHFDEFSRAGHHDVHVDLRARVFFVGEVEHRSAVDDADAGRRDVVHDRNGAQRSLSAHLLSASTSATNAPVIAAVRVPPSA